MSRRLKVTNVKRTVDGEEKIFHQVIPKGFQSLKCGYGEKCDRFIAYWIAYAKNVQPHVGTVFFPVALQLHQLAFSGKETRCHRIHPEEFPMEFTFRTGLPWPEIPHGAEQYLFKTYCCNDYYGSHPLGRCKRKNCPGAHDLNELRPKLCFNRFSCQGYHDQPGKCMLLHANILNTSRESLEDWKKRTQSKWPTLTVQQAIDIAKLHQSKRRQKYNLLNKMVNNGVQLPKQKKAAKVVTLSFDDSEEESEEENEDNECLKEIPLEKDKPFLLSIATISQEPSPLNRTVSINSEDDFEHPSKG